MYFITIGNPIIFWIIRTLVLVAFVFTGWWISNNKYKSSNFSYWKGVTPLIVLYSLAEGLRWGRATDYFHYYQDLTGQLYTDYNEYFYLLWIYLFKNSGLPFWAGFVFYSFILIFSFLYLIRRFPKIAIYALPLFFIITSSQSDNLIRQYFALAFIIFAIAFYFEKRYCWMIFSSIVAEGIHFSAVFPLFVFIISYFLSKRYTPNKPILLVFLFLFVFLLWDNAYFSFVTDVISRYAPETGTGADGYLQSSKFFTADGSLALKDGRKWEGHSYANRIIVFLVYLFVIVAGFYATKKEKKLRYCFFCSYIAILIYVIMGDIEGYIRLYHWLAFIISITVGVIYTRLKLDKTVLYLSWGVMLIYYGYMLMFSRMFVIEPWGYAFIWDR